MGKLYHTLQERLHQQQGTAIATVVSGPEHLGAKLLILADKSTQGSLGQNELDRLVAPDAVRAIWSGQAETRTYTINGLNGLQQFEVFIEGFPPLPRLIIVGAGHIAIPLTTFAKTLNYHVIIVDARAAFATHERFPHADEIIVAWPDTYLESIDLNPSTSVAVLTHDPKFDEPTLKVLLQHEVGYIGAIGSRKTGEERNARLRKQGMTDDQLRRIHSPIGLNLGGSDPNEIALAIMAEIVAVRHNRATHTLTFGTERSTI
jgi:xanthine dehydrogenase accessory factor